MKAADDARTCKRFRRAEFIAQRHQPRHFGLGNGDLAPPPVGERNVGNFKIGQCGHPWLSVIIQDKSRKIYTYLYIVNRSDRLAYMQRPTRSASWVPGYWQQGPNGWVWTEGRWA